MLLILSSPFDITVCWPSRRPVRYPDGERIAGLSHPFGEALFVRTLYDAFGDGNGPFRYQGMLPASEEGIRVYFLDTPTADFVGFYGIDLPDNISAASLRFVTISAAAATIGFMKKVCAYEAKLSLATCSLETLADV